MKQSNNIITVSAPGKLVLLGEHSVVYGRPCLVTAVGQRMKVKVSLLKQLVFELEAPDVNINNYSKPIADLGKGDIPKGAKFVEIGVLNFLSKYKIKTGVRVETTSEFSSQLGFGSSSASTVCIIKALSELIKKKLSNKQLFDLSYKTVLSIQGKGSGVDVASAIYGGTLYFVTAGKVMRPLNLKNLPLAIGYSGIKADTVTLLNQVLLKAKKFPNEIENIYNSITSLVELAKIAAIKEDWVSFGELMDLNQGYLESLGVGIRKLSDMIYAAREAGAYGAKLSGAGGGDCMLALFSPKTKTAISKGIESVGGKIINIKVNVEGVKIES